jgi:hypothetical protein
MVKLLGRAGYGACAEQQGNGKRSNDAAQPIDQ